MRRARTSPPFSELRRWAPQLHVPCFGPPCAVPRPHSMCPAVVALVMLWPQVYFDGVSLAANLLLNSGGENRDAHDNTHHPMGWTALPALGLQTGQSSEWLLLEEYKDLKAENGHRFFAPPPTSQEAYLYQDVDVSSFADNTVFLVESYQVWSEFCTPDGTGSEAWMRLGNVAGFAISKPPPPRAHARTPRGTKRHTPSAFKAHPTAVSDGRQGTPTGPPRPGGCAGVTGVCIMRVWLTPGSPVVRCHSRGRDRVSTGPHNRCLTMAQEKDTPCSSGFALLLP